MYINLVLLITVTVINVFTLFWDRYVYRVKERQLENANEQAIDQLSNGTELRIGKPLSEAEKEAIRLELEEAKKVPFFKRFSGTSKILFIVNILLLLTVGYQYFQQSEQVQIQKVYVIDDYTRNYTPFEYAGNTPLYSKNVKVETVKLYETKINDEYFLKGYSEFSGNFYIQLKDADQEDALLKLKETGEVVNDSAVTVYEGTVMINNKEKK
ncbi:hypothetical protein [Kurthia senegalensis]|uniref:hypothetical protein n=1 Tax=Kurthia senegalensis TaxID=1033740 RepID=UPI000288C885|nr:hypothetical protein [Kurthia senegalensis]